MNNQMQNTDKYLTAVGSTEELSKARQRIDGQCAELRSLEASSAELAQSNADLTQRLDLESQQLEQLQQQLSQQIQQYAELQTVHRQTTVRVADLEDELDSAQQRHASQSAEIQTLEGRTAELAQTKTNLQQQLSEEAERASVLQSAYEQEAHRCEELQKRLASHAAAEETLNARVTAQEAELKSERLHRSGNQLVITIAAILSAEAHAIPAAPLHKGSCVLPFMHFMAAIASFQMLVMRFTDIRSIMCHRRKAPALYRAK